MLQCPLCDSHIDEEEDELDEGDSLICEECGVTLVVTSTDPIELEEDMEEIEDFDDEGEEDEEEDELW